MTEKQRPKMKNVIIVKTISSEKLAQIMKIY